MCTRPENVGYKGGPVLWFSRMDQQVGPTKHLVDQELGENSIRIKYIPSSMAHQINGLKIVDGPCGGVGWGVVRDIEIL